MSLKHIGLLALIVCWWSSISADLIGDICSGTRNVSLCLQQLRSYRGATNLAALGKDAVGESIVDGVLAQNYVNRLRTNATRQGQDKVLISRLNICTIAYTNTMNDLQEWKAQVAAPTINPRNLVLLASAAAAQPSHCDALFATPPDEDPQMIQMSQYLQDVISIVLSISKHFAAGK